MGYDYGVAGPFWFAAGCSPMIVFFALLGISCKRKVPEAHTSLEVVRIRYGTLALEVWLELTDQVISFRTDRSYRFHHLVSD